MKTPGLYLRFGDGDFNLDEGLHDMLALPSLLLANILKEAFSIIDDEVMICIPHRCKELSTLEYGMCGGNHENPISGIKKMITQLNNSRKIPLACVYSSVAISYCSSHFIHHIIDLHYLLKNVQTVFIGNESYSDDFIIKLFGKQCERINVPVRDAFISQTHVLTAFDTIYCNLLRELEYFVIIVASGCAGGAFSVDLYNKYYINKRNLFVLDYGSLLDYLYGNVSREYMNIDPPDKRFILANI